MVTNYPQGLTVARGMAADRAEQQSEGFMSWLLAALSQTVCGLRGHDEVLQFQDNRVQLRCTSCGHESPGWDTGQRPPRLRYQGDARRHLLMTPAKRRQAVMIRKTA
jgi:hypothetical protein